MAHQSSRALTLVADRRPNEYAACMWFELIGSLRGIERIAVGTSLRERFRLRKVYGAGRWRKLKGLGLVRLWDGTIVEAELHWYEAHGIGRCEMKIKRFLTTP